MASDNCTPSVFLVQLGKRTREVRLAESAISVTNGSSASLWEDQRTFLSLPLLDLILQVYYSYIHGTCIVLCTCGRGSKPLNCVHLFV